MRALALVIALCASTAAHAESRAWTAAKKVLPGGLELLGGANVNTIRTSQLFQTLWPLFAQKSKDTAILFDKVKDTCGFDALAQIDSFVLGASLDDSDSSVFVLSLKSSQKDIEQCLVKVDKSLGKTLTITKDGAYTKYNEGGGDAYARWIDSKTIVMTLRAGEKDFLAKMLAGGIAKDPVASAVKSDAAVWVVYNKSEPLDQLSTKMTRAYGSADLKSGTATLNAHIVLPDAATAKTAATKASDQLDAAKKSGAIPSQFAWLVSSMSVKSAGSELVVTASGAETDVADLVKMATQ